MTDTTGPLYASRPSDDLKELAEQLGDCFEEGPDDRSVDLVRDLLDHGTVQVWKRVARGELSAPKTLYDACRPFRQKIERVRRRAGLEPADETALGVHFLLRHLRYAAETLDGVRFEHQLKRQSASEREVLRVLLAERQRAESEKDEMQLLRRGQVHDRMSGTSEVTPTRVGQVLSGLYRQGLLLRQLHPDRGGKEVAFYGLAPSGADLCQRLGLTAPDPKVATRPPSTGSAKEWEISPGVLRRMKKEDGGNAPGPGVLMFNSPKKPDVQPST